MKEEDIDFSRGKEDIVFVHLGEELDTTKISEADKPRERLETEMGKRGLEWENARIIGIFKDEFSLQLMENAEIYLEEEKIGDKR